MINLKIIISVRISSDQAAKVSRWLKLLKKRSAPSTKQETEHPHLMKDMFPHPVDDRVQYPMEGMVPQSMDGVFPHPIEDRVPQSMEGMVPQSMEGMVPNSSEDRVQYPIVDMVPQSMESPASISMDYMDPHPLEIKIKIKRPESLRSTNQRYY